MPKQWADILPENGVMGILGKRRQGKSALAYHVAELRHQQLDTPAAVERPSAGWVVVRRVLSIQFKVDLVKGTCQFYYCMPDRQATTPSGRRII